MIMLYVQYTCIDIEGGRGEERGEERGAIVDEGK